LTQQYTQCSILSLPVHITKPVASPRAVKAALTGSIVAVCVRTIVVARCRSTLLIALASSSLLSIFRALPVGLRLIYRVPASIIVLLPTVTGVLVNVAVVPGIHIAAGSFADCAGCT